MTKPTGWWLGLALLCAGCGMGPPASKQPAATVDTVCDTAAQLMNVKRDKVSATTTLGDLGADELDLVELVMELEDKFDITIPDDAIEVSGEPSNKTSGFHKISMQSLAKLVDERRKLKSPMP